MVQISRKIRSVEVYEQTTEESIQKRFAHSVNGRVKRATVHFLAELHSKPVIGTNSRETILTFESIIDNSKAAKVYLKI